MIYNIQIILSSENGQALVPKIQNPAPNKSQQVQKPNYSTKRTGSDTIIL